MNIGLTFLTFGKNIFAGMENSAYNFAKGVLKTGNNIVIFTSKAYGSSNKIDGINIFRSCFLPLSYTSDDDLISFFKKNQKNIQKDLKNFISKYNLDALVAWDPLWGIVQYADFFKVSSIDCFVVYHFPHSKNILKDSEEYPYKKRYAVSSFLAKNLKQLGVSSEIRILPNAVDMEFIKKTGSVKRQNNLILCNARLSKEKGVRYAVEGFAKFSKRYPEYKLQLCSGSFPFGDFKKEKRVIDEKIKFLEIESKIEYLPNIPWQEVPKRIARAKIVLLPSLRETFGIAALEAMAVGTPLITTRIDNLPNLVGDAAILVEPRSSEQIAKALERLHKDTLLYRNLISLSKKRAADYDAAKVVKTFIKEIKRR